MPVEKEFDYLHAVQDKQSAELEGGEKEEVVEKPQEQPEHTRLKHSVGLGALNYVPDVLLVQKKLYSISLLKADDFQREKRLVNEFGPDGNVPSITYIQETLHAMGVFLSDIIKSETKTLAPGSREESELLSGRYTPKVIHEALSSMESKEASEEAGERQEYVSSTPLFSATDDDGALWYTPGVENDLDQCGVLPPFAIVEQLPDTKFATHMRIKTIIGDQEYTGYVDRKDMIKLLPGNVEVTAEFEEFSTLVQKETGFWPIADPKYKSEFRLARGTKVTCLAHPQKNNWQYVEIEGGRRGYVKHDHLLLRNAMPGADAEVYRIETGDNLDSLIDKFYIDRGINIDKRLIANAILYANNPLKDRPDTPPYTYGDRSDVSVYVNLDPESSEARHGLTYDFIVLKENYDIWLPDRNYINEVFNQGKISSGSRREYIHSKAEAVAAMVADYWPIGFGTHFFGSAGATFGYPVGGQLDTLTYFYRSDEDHIKVVRRIVGKGGLDAGYGAGFFIGKKAKKKQQSNEKKKEQNGGNADDGMEDALYEGKGGEVAASASLMLKAYEHVEYLFPFKKNAALIAAILSLSGKGGVGGVSSKALHAAVSLLDLLSGLQLSPENFISKYKIAGGLEGFGGINLSGGLRMSEKKEPKKKNTATGSTDSEDEKEEAKKIEEHYVVGQGERTPEGAHSGYNEFNLKHIIKRLLNVNVTSELLAEISAGLEIERENKYDVEQDRYVKKKETFTFFIDKSAGFTTTTSLPLVPSLSVGGKNYGVRYSFSVDYENLSMENIIKSLQKKVVVSSGELDYHKEGASEVETTEQVGKLFNAASNVRRPGGKQQLAVALVEQIMSTKYVKRVHIADVVWRQYGAMLSKGRYRQLLKENYRQWGLDLDAFLTVEIDLGKISERIIQRFVYTVLEAYEEADRDVIATIYSLFIDFAMEGKEIVTNLIDKVKGKDKIQPISYSLKTIISEIFGPNSIASTQLYIKLGLGGGAGFNVGQGGKVRLDLMGEVGVTYDNNIVLALAQFEDWYGLIESMMSDTVDQDEEKANKIAEAIELNGKRGLNAQMQKVLAEYAGAVK